MNRIRMELHGAKELEAALRELPFRVAKSALRRSLTKASKVMLEAAQANAPTPRLRVRMVASSTLSRRQRAQARTTRATSGPYVVTAYVGEKPMRHAHLVELGSGPRYSRKTGAYRGVMPAQPYLRPAFDATAQQVIAEFGRVLGQEIEATARRLAKRQAKAASSAAIAAGRGV
jgi:HK97 gp10 family phage protein